jgi:hypothetical protein
MHHPASRHLTPPRTAGAAPSASQPITIHLECPVSEDLALTWRAVRHEGALGTWQDRQRISPAAGSGREHAVRRARLAAMAAVACERETWS